jgi:hypothetical protein
MSHEEKVASVIKGAEHIQGIEHIQVKTADDTKLLRTSGTAKFCEDEEDGGRYWFDTLNTNVPAESWKDYWGSVQPMDIWRASATTSWTLRTPWAQTRTGWKNCAPAWATLMSALGTTPGVRP